MLEEYNAQTYEYNGQKMTEYEASQKQREIERNIRRWKRENKAMVAAGLDTTESAAKVKEWQARQRDFVRQTGLKRQYSREWIKTFTPLENRDTISLTPQEEESFKLLSVAQVKKYAGKMSNRAVRKWYVYHDKQIPSLIDTSASIEEQARQACELRNLYRTQARELMRDQALRAKLDREEPNVTFEQLVAEKMKSHGFTREQACEYILKSATRTRKSVNEQFGIE